MKNNTKNLVIFDVGRTLADVTHQDIVKFFVSKKKMNIPFLMIITFLFFLHKVIGIDERAVCLLTKKAYKVFKNISLKELNSLSEEYYINKFKKKIFKEAINLINEHKRRGDEVVLITALLSNIVDYARKDLGLKYLIAPNMEIKEGVFTGEIRGLIPYGQNKLRLVREFAKQYNFKLEDAYFYSDRYSDLKLFKGVKHKVVFNPEPKLREFAINNGWRIIDPDKP